MNTLEIGVEFNGIILNQVDEAGRNMARYPEDLTDNPEILELCKKIEIMARSEFINNKYEFTYIGFQSKEAEHEYIKTVYQFYVLFKQEMKEKYLVTIAESFIEKYHKIINEENH